MKKKITIHTLSIRTKSKCAWTSSSFQTKQFIGTSTSWDVPPSKCSYLSIYPSVFKLMLHFHRILTLMNDILVLPHCGMRKDWASPFSPPKNVLTFLFIFQSLGLFSVFWIILLFECIFTLMKDLFQRKNQVFKPTTGNKFICTSTLWGGERQGQPILPLQNVSIFLFIFHSVG